jgi:hypothetical protein
VRRGGHTWSRLDQARFEVQENRHKETRVEGDIHGTNADRAYRNEFVNSKEGRALYGEEE